MQTSLALCLGSVALAFLGCSTGDDCYRNVCNELGTGGGTATGGGDQGGQSGSGGTGGGLPASCIPNEGDTIGDDCGIFVSSTLGDDAKGGSKGAPVKTIAKAIELANGKAIYACAETFHEMVVVDAKAVIFGGFDCNASWTYSTATKSQLVVTPNAAALTIGAGASGTEISDFSIEAPSATDAGASAIAVLIDQASVEFFRSELTAGDGAAGEDGGDAPGGGAMAGKVGHDGNVACSSDEPIAGGAQVSIVCDDGGVSIGGTGGAGYLVSGDDGQAGKTGAAGSAGEGEPDVGVGWSCGVNGNGQGGDNGAAGTPGAGANGTGSISASGYAGIKGANGTNGTPGQGGGGGGGAKGTVCAGASGGSGGSGGCGGLAGAGGGAGGASIALLSVNASITLTDSMLTTADGGMGGLGGDGQSGGLGGVGGTGGVNQNDATHSGCRGGDGGPGDKGGPGGGGLGGPSIGIAYQGIAPTLNTTTIQTGVPGAGGLGGNNNLSVNPGADGLAAEQHEFF